MKNLIWLSAYLIISAIFRFLFKRRRKHLYYSRRRENNVNVSLNIAPINAMETNIDGHRTSIEEAFRLLEFDEAKHRCCSYKRSYEFSINSAENSRIQ